MAHLFFSYAHDDYERLRPIHAQMELVTERSIWIDRIGLERGAAWERTIKAAIDESYGVIFAVTKTFVTRPFIVDKEIPWAMARFEDRQGAQLFVIQLDEVELPEALKTPYITHLIDARDGDWERVYKALRANLPAPQDSQQPFVVTWPRLSAFKGRDNQLMELHHKLMGEGRVGVKTAGLYGTGGIGKTQLAVEYAYRYRFYYPGGVFWVNGGADWGKEFGECAVRVKPQLVEGMQEARVLGLLSHLQERGQEVLLVLDNVHEPNEIKRQEIAPKLTVQDLCEQTRVRLLVTTRVQRLPEGFETIAVGVLQAEDAAAVLREAWESGQRTDQPVEAELAALAKAVGYLPLALGWMRAALRELWDVSAGALLNDLRARGLDELIRELEANAIELGTPDYHERLVATILESQLARLRGETGRLVLGLTAAFGEAAVVPVERLRLLAGLAETGLVRPFSSAIRDLQTYSLVETLEDGKALRLHPLTQQYATKALQAEALIQEAAPRLDAAYRDPAILDAQIRGRGFDAVMDDLRQTKQASSVPSLGALTRLLLLEEAHLRQLPTGAGSGYVIQQVRERAYHEGDEALQAACEEWLKDKLHLRHIGTRYPVNKALIRTLVGLSGGVNGAIELRDGRLLSWSDDGTLRLWTEEGEAIRVLEGHHAWVYGATELEDGRLLSWSLDGTLQLWTRDGDVIRVLEGHREGVYGATELEDGRLLSWSHLWSNDMDLRLWTRDGKALSVLQGHANWVNGGLELRDGRLLSWSLDGTLRLWSRGGKTIDVLEGHSGTVSGAIELRDGRLLSWSEDRTLRLWTEDGEAIDVLEGHRRGTNGAIELRDGRLLSWSEDRTLRLWTEDGEAIDVLEGHSGTVSGAIELRDGRLLSWSEDRTLRLWTEDGEAIDVLEGHSREVSGAIELRDGRLLSWSRDHRLWLWTEDGEVVGVLEGHSREVSGATELRDGRLLSWSEDGTLRLWIAVGEGSRGWLGHSQIVTGIAELRDGRLLSWSNDGLLKLWSRVGMEAVDLVGHQYNVYRGRELRDGRILSWSVDGTLRLWTATGELLGVLEGHTDAVFGGRELRDGRILSWSVDGSLRLWSASGEGLMLLTGHTDQVEGAIELRDGSLLSWSEDGALRLWSGDGEDLLISYENTGMLMGATELEDGRLLSWSQDGTLRLWTGEGEALKILEGHTEEIIDTAELEDGRLLSWSRDGALRLWTADGEVLGVLKGHARLINGAMELRDGRLLSWSMDRTLRLWTADGAALAVLNGHHLAVSGAAELQDGRLLSWALDGTVRVWSAAGEALAVYAGDAPIRCCVVSRDGERIVVGDERGRVLFLQVAG